MADIRSGRPVRGILPQSNILRCAIRAQLHNVGVGQQGYLDRGIRRIGDTVHAKRPVKDVVCKGLSEPSRVIMEDWRNTHPCLNRLVSKGRRDKKRPKDKRETLTSLSGTRNVYGAPELNLARRLCPAGVPEMVVKAAVDEVKLSAFRPAINPVTYV